MKTQPLADAGKPRPVHLSASAIKAFLHCPNCFRYAYIEGIRPEQDTDGQRMGTNWHKLHEVYRAALATVDENPSGDSPFDVAVNHLNKAYEHIPDNMTEEDAELERTILAVSFAGYVWYYQNDPVETLAVEVPFELPVFHPKLGLPLPTSEVVRVGKIDRFIRWNGGVSISDYKSTSKSLDPESEFWDHLRLDPQLSMYVMAGQEMAQAGALAQFGITPEEGVRGAFYDVWRKPTIKPSKLTQAETAALMETGKYLDSEFQVEHTPPEGDTPRLVKVNGVIAQAEEGKKGFAIRETSAMYGARLLKDIYERPEFYFARREVPRTADDIRHFRRELYNIWQNIKHMREGGYWYRNDQQDNLLLHGEYGALCYHNVDVSNGQTPPGFRRIFGHQKESA
jgi:hypothetical protein